MRYEIRMQEPSEVAKSYGLTDPLFVVWDTELNKRVAFGNYSDRGRAVARIERLEAKQ